MCRNVDTCKRHKYTIWLFTYGTCGLSTYIWYLLPTHSLRLQHKEPCQKHFHALHIPERVPVVWMWPQKKPQDSKHNWNKPMNVPWRISGSCAFCVDVHDTYSATQLKLIGDPRIKTNKWIHQCSGAASSAFTIVEKGIWISGHQHLQTLRHIHYNLYAWIPGGLWAGLEQSV